MEEIKEKILKIVGESQQGIPSRNLMEMLKPKRRDDYYAALDALRRDGLVTVSKTRRIHTAKEEEKIGATIVAAPYPPGPEGTKCGGGFHC